MKVWNGEKLPVVRIGYTKEDVEILCQRSWSELQKRGLLKLLEEVTPENYRHKVYTVESVERLRKTVVKFFGLSAIAGRRPVKRILDATYIPDDFVAECVNCGLYCVKMDVRRFCMKCGHYMVDWREVFERIKFNNDFAYYEV